MKFVTVCVTHARELDSGATLAILTSETMKTSEILRDQSLDLPPLTIAERQAERKAIRKALWEWPLSFLADCWDSFKKLLEVVFFVLWVMLVGWVIFGVVLPGLAKGGHSSYEDVLSE